MTFRTAARTASLAASLLLLFQTQGQAAHVRSADVLAAPAASWAAAPSQAAFEPADHNAYGQHAARAAGILDADERSSRHDLPGTLDLQLGVDPAMAASREEDIDNLRRKQFTWLNMLFTKAVVDPEVFVDTTARIQPAVLKQRAAARAIIELPTVQIRQPKRPHVDFAQYASESQGFMRFMIEVFQFFGDQMRATKGVLGMASSVE